MRGQRPAPNGAGKSTTLRLLSGEVTPTEGEGAARRSAAVLDLVRREQALRSVGYGLRADVFAVPPTLTPRVVVRG